MDSEYINDIGGEIARNRKAAENQGVKFDIRNIVVDIPDNVYIEPSATGIYNLDNIHRAKYARTQAELERVFDDFCLSVLSGYEKAHSLGVLKNNIIELMEALFGVFETDAMKVILAKQNLPKFEHVIRTALENYARSVLHRRKQRKQRSFVKYIWEVPEERYYNAANNHEVETVREHALLPFIEKNNVSGPELRFTKFLEDSKTHIDWWYKNGDEGKQHYAISYTNSQGDRDLFYPDFVIRLHNGQVYLFDTKTEGSDPEAPAKHNALIEYINDEANRHLHLKGGVLIERGSNWLYSEFRINDTADLKGWTAFFPDI